MDWETIAGIEEELYSCRLKLVCSIAIEGDQVELVERVSVRYRPDCLAFERMEARVSRRNRGSSKVSAAGG